MNSQQHLPETITSEDQLDEFLTRPSQALVNMITNLEGDILILGIGGKMGPTLGGLAVRAVGLAGTKKKVFGVSRFSDSFLQTKISATGVETIACDLLDPEAITGLPKVQNVIFMAGRKFGSHGDEPSTWMTNVILPEHVCRHFQGSRIVVFSTGCVYPLIPVTTGGSLETDPPDPVGEYAQSCLGRERVFEYWSQKTSTPLCLLRLNYAVDLRYGVLLDIGRKVFNSQPVDLSVSHFNVIWQADACSQALRCLTHSSIPANKINLTGPETACVRQVALEFARLFNCSVTFSGSEQESRMYLSNAGKAAALFGYPSVPLRRMIQWQAEWIKRGGRTLDKPTHFDVTNGKF
jgi:nucleoside-diphosphate-sugar epimerase